MRSHIMALTILTRGSTAWNMDDLKRPCQQIVWIRWSMWGRVPERYVCAWLERIITTRMCWMYSSSDNLMPEQMLLATSAWSNKQYCSACIMGEQASEGSKPPSKFHSNVHPVPQTSPLFQDVPLTLWCSAKVALHWRGFNIFTEVWTLVNCCTHADRTSFYLLAAERTNSNRQWRAQFCCASECHGGREWPFITIQAWLHINDATSRCEDLDHHDASESVSARFHIVTWWVMQTATSQYLHIYHSSHLEYLLSVDHWYGRFEFTTCTSIYESIHTKNRLHYGCKY